MLGFEGQTVVNFKKRIENIISHYGFQRYLKNTSWMFFGQFVSMALSLLVSIFLARYLGPDSYGLMNYVISFCILFAFLASFGIDTVLSRELVKNPSKYNDYLGTGFIIKLIGALISVMVIFLVTYAVRTDHVSRLLIMIFSFSFIFQSLYVISNFFQSRVEAKHNIIAQTIANFVSSGVKLLLIFLQADIFWFVCAYASDTAILGFFYILVYRKNRLQIKKWRFNSSLAKDLLKDSWPFMFSALAITIYMKIDQVMIKGFMDDSAVGIYAAAAKISEVWYFIPYIICSSLFPAIVNARKNSLEQFNGRLKKLYALLFWPSFVIAIFVTFTSNWIITLLFGPAYAGAGPILSVHIWSGVGFFLSSAVAQFIITENYNKIFFTSTLLSATMNIGLNFVLIPKMGIMGAAVATLISYFFLLFFIVFFKKTRGQLFNIFNGILFRY